MKLLVIVILFSSILFSAQKQIILGSYSVQSNGIGAVKTVTKQIENDENLQELMQKNSLRVISTKISGYTVVSVNALGSYTELLRTLKIFKTYYTDAFVLTYPTQNIQDIESLAAIEHKAQEENANAKEEEIIEEERLEALALERLEKERLQELQEQREARLIEEKVEKERLLALQTKRLEEAQALKMTQDKAEIEDDMSEYYLFIALGLLLISIAGFVVYSQINKKEEES